MTGGYRLDRWRFSRRYHKVLRRSGRYMTAGATQAAYDRGLETRWQAYQQLQRRVKIEGRRFRTTNRQRAQAALSAGRWRVLRPREGTIAEDPSSPLGARTMRRIHRDLEAMGLVRVKWVVKSGPARRPGQLDCLEVVVFDRAYVRPPLRGRKAKGLRPLTSPSPSPDVDGLEGSAACGGRQKGPAPPLGDAGRTLTEERQTTMRDTSVERRQELRQELTVAIRHQYMMIHAGFDQEKCRTRIGALAAELRRIPTGPALGEPGSPGSPPGSPGDPGIA